MRGWVCKSERIQRIPHARTRTHAHYTHETHYYDCCWLHDKLFLVHFLFFFFGSVVALLRLLFHPVNASMNKDYDRTHWHWANAQHKEIIPSLATQKKGRLRLPLLTFCTTTLSGLHIRFCLVSFSWEAKFYAFFSPLLFIWKEAPNVKQWTKQQRKKNIIIKTIKSFITKYSL